MGGGAGHVGESREEVAGAKGLPPCPRVPPPTPLFHGGRLSLALHGAHRDKPRSMARPTHLAPCISTRCYPEYEDEAPPTTQPPRPPAHPPAHGLHTPPHAEKSTGAQSLRMVRAPSGAWSSTRW